MRTSEIRQSVDNFGIARTACDLALRAINRLVFFKILRGVVIEKADPRFLVCDDRYRFSRLEERTLRKFAASQDYELSDGFLRDAFARGDECYGFLDDVVLAAYGWYTRRPTSLDRPGPRISRAHLLRRGDQFQLSPIVLPDGVRRLRHGRHSRPRRSRPRARVGRVPALRLPRRVVAARRSDLFAAVRGDCGVGRHAHPLGKSRRSLAGEHGRPAAELPDPLGAGAPSPRGSAHYARSRRGSAAALLRAGGVRSRPRRAVLDPEDGERALCRVSGPLLVLALSRRSLEMPRAGPARKSAGGAGEHRGGRLRGGLSRGSSQPPCRPRHSGGPLRAQRGASDLEAPLRQRRQHLAPRPARDRVAQDAPVRGACVRAVAKDPGGVGRRPRGLGRRYALG